jgi:DsbC/DsbD-like thiol-disulfide interchange protein
MHNAAALRCSSARFAGLLGAFAAALAMGAGVSDASAQAGLDDEPEPARPSLIAESEGLVAGATNRVAVRFELDEGWHVYWRGQNATGFAATIELDLPEGWEAGPIVWPAPHRHVLAGGILDYIYENDQAVFVVPVTIPADAPTGPVRLNADLEWLVCREACIPGWATVSLDTRVLPPTARPRPSVEAPLFEKAASRTPTPFPTGAAAPRPPVELAFSGDGAARTLTVTPRPERTDRAIEWIAFYPDEDGATLADPIRTGLSGAKDDTPVPPLRLRFSGDEPVRGILEIRFRGAHPSLLYRIEHPIRGETTPGPE